MSEATEAEPLSTREWVLGIALLAIAAQSALGLLSAALGFPLWLGIVHTLAFRGCMVVAGACLRPRALGVVVVVLNLFWLLLDLLTWTGLFDLGAWLWEQQPFLYFQF